MAQQVVRYFTDDLNGERGEDVTTHTFALDGHTYEIDLSAGHYEQLCDALAPYLSAGRRLKKTPAGRPVTRVSGPDPVAVRTWAQEQGITVNARGRVPRPVIEAYLAAVAGNQNTPAVGVSAPEQAVA
ncbi:Lsr2 family protein [Streptomyces sp. N35]|uniref:histone-like nucleoid-structuring protein Lsr2 n=1 Tax=Streptomyces sp. N35 TaxID=2795730 RepID=UPI0018F3DCEB|nr:Lsr2 family protein [Streptomyces sp. N35]